MNDIRVIATAIGYYFWKCQTDAEAYRHGLDAAVEVIKALEENEMEIENKALEIPDRIQRRRTRATFQGE